MGPMAAVERFLERLFERQTARLFKTAIRPIQVQRRLERAMEGARIRDGSRTLVPYQFTVRLTPDDLAAVRAMAPALAADLADGALAFARAHGYSLLDRPRVALRPDPSVEHGDIVVDAGDPTVRGGPELPDPGPSDPLVARGGADAASASAHASVGQASLDEPGRTAEDAGGAPASPLASAPPAGFAEGTAVFVVPGVDGPRATLRETRPDGTTRTIVFDGRPLTIGRGPDNGLVVRDGRASRHHARIDGRRGTLVLSDLGSTNGSFVNDRRVDSVALGAGDRIRIGTTSILIEALGEDPRPGDEGPGVPDADG
ncbi:MAG TPA: FhaA domain-containing protein [Candidatus Limnocylindrales bacterium]|nr:FhaA domain-containing protein [Candidatus Limnocylindrales bacterium]